MKKQLQQLRRFFVRTKKLNLTATRNAMPATYEEDDEGSSRLSGAFIVVLLLHVVAIIGVFAFSRIKDSRAATTNPTSTSLDGTSVSPKGSTLKVAASATGANSDQHHSDVAKNVPALPPAGKTYVVKSGDNLTKIAIAHGTTPSDLVSTNSLKNENDVRAGQVLSIPDGKAAKPAPAPETKPFVKATAPVATQSGPKTYVIQKGDTIAKIARENNCTYEELVKLNNIKDPKKLQPGQSVKIPAIKKG